MPKIHSSLCQFHFWTATGKHPGMKCLSSSMPTLDIQMHKPSTVRQSLLRHSVQQVLSETLKMQQQLPPSAKTAQFNHHHVRSLSRCQLWRPTLPFHQLWHLLDPLKSEFSSLNWQKSNTTKQNKSRKSE